MTALALLVVTAALAVLLAVWLHLAWPPVLVSVVGTVPTLYLAWLAVPGVISQKRSTHGRRAALWTPVELGAHKVIGGGPMPTYVRRPHDELLRAVLDPGVPASRLVVVRGASSTGKTRAAYEAVVDRLADWQLDYPLDPAALKERLDAGIPSRTVLWLGELRQYADADGGAEVLGRLADLLQGEGHLLITTMWPEQWNTYTAAARPRPKTGLADGDGTAGRLLEPLPELTDRDPAGIDPARGGVVDVPDRFVAADLEAAARTGDPLLAKAAAAAASAGRDGQLTQYLAGVPDLLDRFEGSGGDPYGQAVVTAAMDAARLGHASPLPAALLQEAAVGYLTDRQRTEQLASWRDAALAWAAEELKGAARALEPVPPPSGTGVVGYRVADYLDQHGRRTRQDQLGSPSLWDALVAHTDSGYDLTILAQVARDRGLYRYAAALWTAAVTMGSADAACQLITHLRQVSPADISRAARWAADHASIADPWTAAELLGALGEAGAGDAVTALATRAATDAGLDKPSAIARLLGALREAGADGAVSTLLARDPARHASLDNPRAAAELLGALGEAGAGDAVAALATRAARHASLDNPSAIARLLRALDEAGAGDAVTALAARAATHASLEDPWTVAWLLRALREPEVGDAVTVLATRAARHASLDNSRAIAELLKALREAGVGDAVTVLATRAARYASLDNPRTAARLLPALREAGASDAVTTLLARDPARHASLDNPRATAELLGALGEAGAGGAVTVLATRAAWHASLDNPSAIARLLRALGEAGAGDAVTALAARAARHASLEDPWTVAWLLRALREAGASDAASTLLARDPARHASLDNPSGIADLLRALREAGASDAVTTLLARDPARHASLDNPSGIADLLEALREAGTRDAVSTLVTRAARDASLDNPSAAAWLLRALGEAGAGDEVSTLLARDPARHASLDNPSGIADLLAALRETGARDAVSTLVTRAANAGMFDLFLQIQPGEASSYLFGREPDGIPSQSWKWQEPANPNRTDAA